MEKTSIKINGIGISSIDKLNGIGLKSRTITTASIENSRFTKEYKTFFILNEEKAGMARKRAMERSLLETKIAVKEAEEISRFVNEGFNLD